MECSKRQKQVSPDGVTFRCINRECPAWGHEATPDMCSNCEHRVFKKKGCKEVQKIALATPDEKEFMEKKAAFEPDEIIERTPDDSPPPNHPATSIQMWMYKEALLKWKRAGYPTRTQEEVKEIHEKHCTKCEWYDAEKKRCKGCGCRVTDGAVAVVNKIKMATEHCPREIW